MTIQLKTTRLETLDSWRGICALLVATFHFPIQGVVRSVDVVSNAYLFVDFFFVLSGFVIGRGYEERLRQPGEILPFIIRRWGRVWPLHASILALFVASSIVRGKFGTDMEHSPTSIFTNVTLLHSLGLHKTLTWNDPSWSISVEFTLYFLFIAISFTKNRSLIYISLIICSVLVLLYWAPYGMASTYDFGIFRGAAGFFSGILVARLRIVDCGALIETLVTLSAVIFVGLGTAQILAPGVFCAVVWVYAGSRGPLARLMKTPVPMALGRWSYSLYMTHTIIVGAIWASADFLGLSSAGSFLQADSTREFLIFGAYLTATVGLSFITYNLIENPARRWFEGASRHQMFARTNTE